MNDEQLRFNKFESKAGSKKVPELEGAKKDAEPSLTSALVANFFMPGLGSWRLGAKKRGAS